MIHKNYEMLIKGIKEDLNKLKDVPYSWIGEISTTMSVFLESIDRISVSFIKLLSKI